MNAKDIAVESKITFSRNVKGYPFPSKLRDTRANVIASGVYEALAKNGGYELYKIAQMSEPGDCANAVLYPTGLFKARTAARL